MREDHADLAFPHPCHPWFNLCTRLPAWFNGFTIQANPTQSDLQSFVFSLRPPRRCGGLVSCPPPLRHLSPPYAPQIRPHPTPNEPCACLNHPDLTLNLPMN